MSRRPTMDTIQTPDLNNLDKEQGENLYKIDRYSRKEDHSGKFRASFDNAANVKVDDLMNPARQIEEPPDGNEISEEFTAKNIGDGKPMSRGVKFFKTYVSKRKIVKISVIAAAVIIFVLLFVPPVFTSDDEGCRIREEDIFAALGASQYKTQLTEENYVYNMEAMSSDESSDYRICTVAFKARNFLPFEVSAEDFIISNGGKYSKYIVYSTSAEDSKTIPAHSEKTIYVDVLINRAELDDDQLNEAITSLTITSKGLKKNVFGLKIPCFPVWMNVSNVTTFSS